MSGAEAQGHSISENLELIRAWTQQQEAPRTQRERIVSLVRTGAVVAAPALLVAGISWMLSNAASASSISYCDCPDGGVGLGSRRQIHCSK